MITKYQLITLIKAKKILYKGEFKEFVADRVDNVFY